MGLVALFRFVSALVSAGRIVYVCYGREEWVDTETGMKIETERSAGKNSVCYRR